MFVNLKAVKASLVASAAASLALLGLAACGPAGAALSGHSGSKATRAPAATSRPAAKGAPMGFAVAVKVASVSGVGTVLVDASGYTLYRDAPETAGGIATLTCVGPCTSTWHPLLVPPSDLRPVAGSGVPGALGVVSRPDGASQVSWQGSPLYTYLGDTAPGQAKGQGVAHTWSVIKVNPA